jgi:hydrogenase 3 maturation protease
LSKLGDLEGELRQWLENAERVVVIGVGNELRKDDFVGVEVVRRLRNKVPARVMLVESETVPESYLDKITSFKPTHVLIIDAGLLGLRPGEVRLVESTEFPSPTAAVSTHALPLRIFCEVIERTTDARIALLIIQPKTTGFGEGLTGELEKAAERITTIFVKVLRTYSIHSRRLMKS